MIFSVTTAFYVCCRKKFTSHLIQKLKYIWLYMLSPACFIKLTITIHKYKCRFIIFNDYYIILMIEYLVCVLRLFFISQTYKPYTWWIYDMDCKKLFFIKLVYKGERGVRYIVRQNDTEDTKRNFSMWTRSFDSRSKLYSLR